MAARATRGAAAGGAARMRGAGPGLAGPVTGPAAAAAAAGPAMAKRLRSSEVCADCSAQGRNGTATAAGRARPAHPSRAGGRGGAAGPGVSPPRSGRRCTCDGPGWFGWEGSLKPLPSVGRDTFQEPRLLQAPSRLAWDASRAGDKSVPSVRCSRARGRLRGQSSGGHPGDTLKGNGELPGLGELTEMPLPVTGLKGGRRAWGGNGTLEGTAAVLGELRRRSGAAFGAAHPFPYSQGEILEWG